MRKYKLTVVYLFLVPLFLISCASSQITPERPLTVGLNIYKNFVLSVESMVTEDVEKELADLRGLVLSRVMPLNVFDEVRLLGAAEPEESTLLLKIIITDIRKVSTASRFVLGAFAGEASMTNKLLFIDAATNEKLGEYSVTGYSGSSAYAGGTNEAIEKTLEAIVEVISNNFNM